MLRGLYLFFSALLLSACNVTLTTVNAEKSLGGRQCEPAVRSLVTLRQELINAGISVIGEGRESHDTRMHISQCGAPDGKTGVFEIHERDTKKAASIGFTVHNTRT